MMTELRKKETRKSLKRVQIPLDPPNSGSPGLPDRQNVPDSQSPTGMSLQPLLPNDNTTRSCFDSVAHCSESKNPLTLHKFGVAQLAMTVTSLLGIEVRHITFKFFRYISFGLILLLYTSRVFSPIRYKEIRTCKQLLQSI